MQLVPVPSDTPWTNPSDNVQSITVLGRRWFNRGPGNTYHSAQIMVNGKTVHRIEFAYGYDQQYLWNAAAWLEENGYLPGREHYSNGGAESLWSYADRNGITCEYSATDVQRKKDL